MDFVVLTLAAYNAMEETAHLLSSPANASRLLESIDDVEKGKVLTKRLDIKTNPHKKSKVGKPVASKRG